MFKKSTLDAELDHILAEMNKINPASEEYRKMAESVEILSKAKAQNRGVTPDTIILAITNLFGIGMILNHERLGVISSKAVGFIMKRF